MASISRRLGRIASVGLSLVLSLVLVMGISPAVAQGGAEVQEPGTQQQEPVLELVEENVSPDPVIEGSVSETPTPSMDTTNLVEEQASVGDTSALTSDDFVPASNHPEVSLLSTQVDGIPLTVSNGEAVHTEATDGAPQIGTLAEPDSFDSYTVWYGNNLQIKQGNFSGDTPPVDQGKSLTLTLSSINPSEHWFESDTYGPTDWHLNSLTVNNSIALNVPFSYTPSANNPPSATTTLPNGTVITVTLAGTTVGLRYMGTALYSYTYSVEIANISEDVRFTSGNFKAAKRPEIVVRDLASQVGLIGNDTEYSGALWEGDAVKQYIPGSNRFVINSLESGYTVKVEVYSKGVLLETHYPKLNEPFFVENAADDPTDKQMFVTASKTEQNNIEEYPATKMSSVEGAVQVGDSITYTITYKNTSDIGTPAEKVTITDRLPFGTSYVSASATKAGAQAVAPSSSTSGGITTITWTDDLAAGQTAVVTIEVEVTDREYSPVKNTASVQVNDKTFTTNTVTNERKQVELSVVITGNNGTCPWTGSEQVVAGYDVIVTDSRGFDVTSKNLVSVSLENIVLAEAKRTDIGTTTMGIEKHHVIFSVTNRNYTIKDYSVIDGYITIVPVGTVVIPITSAEKMYDGTTLNTSSHGAVQGLHEGDYVDNITYTGSITNFGTVTASADPASVVIKNRDGKVTTQNYEGIRIDEGELRITARPVILQSGSSSKVHDGSALTVAGVTVGGAGFVGADGVTWTMTGSQTDVGSSPNSFSYVMRAGTLAENYSITTSFGTLTITAASGSPVIIPTPSPNPAPQPIPSQTPTSTQTPEPTSEPKVNASPNTPTAQNPSTSTTLTPDAETPLSEPATNPWGIVGIALAGAAVVGGAVVLATANKRNKKGDETEDGS